MKFQTLKTNRGFTLIETLVALSIFSVSIVGLVSVTASGVANSNYAKNKFIASYLAQEGVEMVRNIRDNAALSTPTAAHWTTFLTNVATCTASVGCKIEPQSLAVTPCVIPLCPVLNYDQSNGFYKYTSGTASSFRRKITVDDSIGADEVKVTSVVSWTQGGASFSTSFSENLLNWIQ